MKTKPAHYALIITVMGLTGLALALQFFNFSLQVPSTSSARIAKSVGDTPAPMPVLLVEDVQITTEQSLNINQVQASINSSVGGQGINPKFELTQYQLSWQVSVDDGSLAPVMAQVYVPKGTLNQQFPVIVYGPGSTGLADRCAPSRENLARGNMGNYRNYIISQASQGYIVVMPNYEGLDNPNRNQHYFNRDSEARTMLSAAKATLLSRSQVSLPIKNNALFFGGYSQGGHAAFSAADYADTYTPDLHVSGVYGHGPTTDIIEFLRNNPNLAAYFVASYSEYYPAIDPETLLEPEWIGYLERARNICVDEGFGINSTTMARVYADAFEMALRRNSIAQDFPDIYAVFEENSAGTSFTNIPAMIVQGTGDPIVTNAAQGQFVDQLCQRNVAVELKEYPGVHHFSTRQVSFKDTNAWIDTIVNGGQTSNTCLNR